MATPHPTIFRTEALQHRLNDRGRRPTEASFPRLMSRRVFLILWLLMGLLVLSGAAACFARVPVSAAGLAIVVGPEVETGDVSVIALMPPKLASRMQEGDRAQVRPGTADSAIASIVTDVESEPQTATAIEKHLGLPASSLAMLDGPMLMVRLSVTPDVADTLAPGMTGRAEIPAGTRHAGAFLPVIGHVFRSDK